LVVDVAQERHLGELRERGEVIEIDAETAKSAGWDGYVEGVQIWQLSE
jgi:hypothetical protein